MRWLIVGGTGLLGDALLRALEADPLAEVSATWNTSRPERDGPRWHQLDVADDAAVGELVGRAAPDVVINAAYAKGGPALEPVTGRAPGVLARRAAETQARFIHVSSDAIFDGPPGYRHTEADPPNPCTPYGQAKASSEPPVAEANGIIVRSSLLYGGDRPQPQRTLVMSAAAGEDITFFTDEVRCPAHVDDAAAAIIEVAVLTTPPPVLHIGGADMVDRLTFARLLARSMGIDPSGFAGAPTPEGIVRPKHSAMSNTLASQTLRTPIPGVHARLGTVA